MQCSLYLAWDMWPSVTLSDTNRHRSKNEDASTILPNRVVAMYNTAKAQYYKGTIKLLTSLFIIFIIRLISRSKQVGRWLKILFVAKSSLRLRHLSTFSDTKTRMQFYGILVNFVSNKLQKLGHSVKMN